MKDGGGDGLSIASCLTGLLNLSRADRLSLALRLNMVGLAFDSSLGRLTKSCSSSIIWY